MCYYCNNLNISLGVEFMKGYDILFNKIKEIINDKYINVELKNIENGFKFEVEGFPYTFKIICYEQIGWNVFLEPIGDIYLVEHPETNLLYKKIEDIIDEVNYEYYELDENLKSTVDKNFNELKIQLEAHSQHIDSMERKELKYFIRLNNVDKTTLEIRYSISMNKWILSGENLFNGGNIHDEIFELYNCIARLVEDFNRQIDTLDYYF